MIFSPTSFCAPQHNDSLGQPKVANNLCEGLLPLMLTPASSVALQYKFLNTEPVGLECDAWRNRMYGSIL